MTTTTTQPAPVVLVDRDRLGSTRVTWYRSITDAEEGDYLARVSALSVRVEEGCPRHIAQLATATFLNDMATCPTVNLDHFATHHQAERGGPILDNTPTTPADTADGIDWVSVAVRVSRAQGAFYLLSTPERDALLPHVYAAEHTDDDDAHDVAQLAADELAANLTINETMPW